MYDVFRLPNYNVFYTLYLHIPLFMKKVVYSLLLLCFTDGYAMAQGKDETTIRTMLSAQVQAWNAGSVDGYMHGYWDSDSLLFIGGKGPRYGYKATLQRYKEAYPDAAHMGKLTSVVTSMQQLSQSYYFIVGTWALARNRWQCVGLLYPVAA